MKEPKRKSSRVVEVKFSPFSTLFMCVGVLIILVGIYFHQNNLTSSGATMGKSGAPYGTATMNGKAMIYLGGIIFLLGIPMVIKHKK